jgi:predicted nucleic acid-binding protein
MISLFIDSGIILDLLLKRNEYDAAAALFTGIVGGEYHGCTSPIVLANIHYIAARFAGKRKAMGNIRKLRSVLSVLPVDEEIVDAALGSDLRDFEDAVQCAAARAGKVDLIITRNKKEYRGCAVPVLTAREFLELASSGGF